MKESTVLNNLMTTKSIIIKIHNEEINAPDIVKEFCSNEQKYNQLIKSIDALIEAESYESGTMERTLAFKKFMNITKDTSRETFITIHYAKEVINTLDVINKSKEGFDLNYRTYEPFKENKDKDDIIIYNIEKDNLQKMLLKKYEYEYKK